MNYANLKLLSLVMPTLDVDFENDARTKLFERAKGLPNPTTTAYDDDKEVLQSVQQMGDMLNSYNSQKNDLYRPRSLYVPYNSTVDSNIDNLNRRIKNQVLCIYLSSQLNHTLPVDKSLLKHDNSPPNQVNGGLPTAQHKPQEQGVTASPPQDENFKSSLPGIITPQLWVFMIFMQSTSKSRRNQRQKTKVDNSL
jgi:hypothetical protein